MRTIETQLFKFSELSDAAKQKAIDQYREKEYRNWDASWVVDDCYLFEPKYAELHELFGKEYDDRKSPIIGNTRKVYFDTDRNSHLDADEGIVISGKDEHLFLTWLGIDEELQGKICWNIKNTGGRHPDTIIEFEPYCPYEFSEQENEILERAADKFSDHMDNVLKGISEHIDDYFSDDNISEIIELNEIEFYEDGTMYF